MEKDNVGEKAMMEDKGFWKGKGRGMGILMIDVGNFVLVPPPPPPPNK